MVHVDHTATGAATPRLDANAERRMKERQKMHRYRQRLAAKALYLRDLTRKLETEIREHLLQRQASQTHMAECSAEECDQWWVMHVRPIPVTTLLHPLHALLELTPTTAVSPTCSAKRLLQRWVPTPRRGDSRLRHWITRYLHHHCDSSFQRMGFPPSDAVSEFSLDMTDPDCCMYVWRSHRDFPASLKLHLRGWTIEANVAISHDDEARCSATCTEWGPNNPNVHDDAVFPTARFQRNRMIWIALAGVAELASEQGASIRTGLPRKGFPRPVTN
ncbi:hypothetical protein H310_03040 [Aphanomyces invadans]|uniref:Uncharacterized protein n=1 Tax=Aphanomyces invadans TaxID=157072 RepID=A0A024UKX7_9STRA|nr:hypothetical protein H310_03040 [Aphanomyces invadans]ETW06929.1 hypothetical protein H310_03040 [Aphanomyces invadans]|eukprot:XP_008865004.1 hypothetical protein H310_03040 [Aphanomyces invadans]